MYITTAAAAAATTTPLPSTNNDNNSNNNGNRSLFKTHKGGNCVRHAFTVKRKQFIYLKWLLNISAEMPCNAV